MAKQQILINNSNRIDTGSVALIKELRKAGIIKTGRKRRAPKEILAVNDATGGAYTTPMYRTVMQAPTDVYQRIPDRENPQLRRVGPNDLGANQQNVDVVQQLDAGQNVYGDAPVRGREQGLPEAQKVFEGENSGIRPPEGQRSVGEEGPPMTVSEGKQILKETKQRMAAKLRFETDYQNAIDTGDIRGAEKLKKAYEKYVKKQEEDRIKKMQGEFYQQRMREEQQQQPQYVETNAQAYA